jgi:hypothetical protein
MRGFGSATVKLADPKVFDTPQLRDLEGPPTPRRPKVEVPPELKWDYFGVYSPDSDVYMWAMSMCLAAIHALPDVGAMDTRYPDERGITLFEPLSPDVALLLRECLDDDRHKRPCSSEARDRVLAAAGVWPPLGGWLVLLDGVLPT